MCKDEEVSAQSQQVLSVLRPASFYNSPASREVAIKVSLC